MCWSGRELLSQVKGGTNVCVGMMVYTWWTARYFKFRRDTITPFQYKINARRLSNGKLELDSAGRWCDLLLTTHLLPAVSLRRLKRHLGTHLSFCRIGCKTVIFGNIGNCFAEGDYRVTFGVAFWIMGRARVGQKGEHNCCHCRDFFFLAWVVFFLVYRLLLKRLTAASWRENG